MTAVNDGNGWVINPILIETRGDGGQAVISPSPGYQLIQPGDGEVFEPPVISDDERQILIEIAREFHEPLIKDAVSPRKLNYLGAYDQRPGDEFNDGKKGVKED